MDPVGMDCTTLTNRERRRKVTASRRAARENAGGNEGGESFPDADNNRNAYQTPDRPKDQRQRPPIETNLISSLSQALTNIDKHNTDHFSSKVGGDGANVCGLRDDSVTINFSSSNNNSSYDADRKPKHYSKLPPPPSQFSSYIKFNRPSLNCLLAFTACYLLILICCYPMISYSNLDDLANDDEIGAKHHIKRGASFERIRGRKQIMKASHAVTDKLGTLKERAVEWEERAKLQAKRGAVELQEKEREIIDSIAGGTIGRRGGADARRATSLLERAVEDFEGRRREMEKEEFKRGQVAMAGGHDHWADAVEAWDREFVRDNRANDAGAVLGTHKRTTPGFMVLGMHRSGTSMLSGLLVKGFGYETGGPLIGANFDNEKGFYERIDVVLQNDEFMGAQHAGWSWNVIDYDSEKALQHKQQGKITFKEGKTALKFLNNHMKTLPYLQKDPRMCICLPTWLKLLDDKPAILFTYRHPLEVALSLSHREENFTIEHGLRLWIVYNMRALQNSEGLCRVFSTNEAVFKDPMNEVQRIKNELTDKCRVIPPPGHELPRKVVDEFLDPKLQHNSKERKAEEAKRGTLKDYGGGCVAREFESEYPEASANRKAEVEMYLMAMRVFCDFENGRAYASDYEW
eukprot:CAMPEP_0172532266 /NCGR_PEP_ID=MMETSP1067-20121228/5385_1 /TAXON_ID=265564 ORGANISM="Thalassiosira punctigera, Strain Tpunct2005C2" /NCGR_SAMPLE_ID=MMETSP1067 /ASSEMBLY_ACC=CAM_ASM_000444 /LENGTH=632 /DNA_ID=CAMNT_0013316767 /DNA_START=104 /DNA_END=1999 /DNA_ORIENTATION=+